MRLVLQTITGILFAGAVLSGCSSSESSQQQLLNQGCNVNTPDPRACDPADTKKTTICHIPLGNPANAHTICVGNAAVPAHLNNHGDFIGTCSCTGGSSDGGVGDVDASGGGGSGSGDTDAGTGGGSADAGIVL